MSNTDHWNRIISNLYRGSDYLMHHGVKGQKWGVRNYQNPDGSLTAAGKKRYGTRDVRIRTPERMQKDVIGKAVKFNPEGGGGGYYEVDEWENENNKIESEIAQLEKDLEDIEKDLDAVENDSIGRETPGFNNRENARKDLQKKIKEMKDALKRKRESEQAFLKDYVAKDDVSRKMKTSFGHSDTFNDVLMAYYDNSYLSHHGILGQKWGVRRFQNKDGTRTTLGKRRRDGDGKDGGEAAKSENPRKILKSNGVSEKSYKFKDGHEMFWYEKKLPEIDDGKARMHLTGSDDHASVSDPDEAKKIAELSHKVAKQVKSANENAKEIATADLYDGYGKYWQDSDHPVSREHFRKSLALDIVEADVDRESLVLYYRDKSNLFLGHIVVVEIDKDGKARYARIEG